MELRHQADGGSRLAGSGGAGGALSTPAVRARPADRGAVGEGGPRRTDRRLAIRGATIRRPASVRLQQLRRFAIRPMRALPPNGYGLYAMCGGVWEWTRDWYDREAYRRAADRDPDGPSQGEERAAGGSWADCAEAVTVTFRMSRVEQLAARPTGRPP
ncbi:MAG: SUMF1/EgtB/PvdO family nonheme iron enzyme [Gemmataceae bacterium]